MGVLIIVSMFEPVRASITARRAGESNVGGGIATAWMLFGVVVLVPDVIWAGASVIGILILRQWWFGRPDAVVWLHAAMLGWLVLFLPSTMDSVTDALQLACLTVGLLAIGFSSGKQGRVFAYTPSLDEGNVVQKGEFDFTTAQGRKNITQSLEISGIVLLLCTPTFAYGIGHLVGAIMGTRQLLRRPTDAGIACLPVLHAMAAVVVLRAIFGDGVEITQVSGVVLAVESTVLLYIGLTQQDPISTWLQNLAPETVRSRDTMGVLGISYLVVSVLMLFANADSWTLRYLLIAAICLSLGINGFGSNGTSWQRAIGIYGGLVAMIGLSISIDGDNAGFWRSLIFLVIGMIAFGFGTLYLQRQGGPSSVLTETTMEMKMVQGGTTYGQTVPAEPLPTPVRSTEDLNAIDGEEDPSPEEGLEAVADVEVSEQEAPEPTSAPEERATETTAVDDMMDLLIDDAMRARLHVAIRNTPHEGFRPTLKITERGDVMLEFLPI